MLVFVKGFSKKPGFADAVSDIPLNRNCSSLLPRQGPLTHPHAPFHDCVYESPLSANWRSLPLIARSFSSTARGSDMAHRIERRRDGSLRRGRPEITTCIAYVDVLNLPPL
jgi:hypothetical protein